MSDTTPPTRGRKIFNAFAAFVLVLFALFCIGITAGVIAIPKLLEASQQP
jgi:hypothetical protein